MRGNSLEIRNVRPDSPAEKAGLLSGDVITGIAGKPVDDAAAFAFRLRRSPVDEPLSVTVRRGEKAITVTPVLRELVPGQEPLFAGIAVSTVKSTVVVAHVSSRLAAAGLRAGDRVLELNGEEIHDGDALLDRIADLKPKTEIRLKIRRGDDELTLTMTD
jgi:S1-C subfamily serine protease